MPRKRYTTEQIINKLREAEVLISQDRPASLTRSLAVSFSTAFPTCVVLLIYLQRPSVLHSRVLGQDQDARWLNGGLKELYCLVHLAYDVYFERAALHTIATLRAA